MDARVERAARNEALFRDVNERIAEAAAGFASDRVGAICECHDTSCVAIIEVSVDEYEAVRAHGDRFALADGHEEPELERVVDRTDRFIVVEKLAEGAEIATDLDPRS